MGLVFVAACYSVHFVTSFSLWLWGGGGEQKWGYKVKITLFVLGFLPIDWVTDGSGVKERETRPKQW